MSTNSSNHHHHHHRHHSHHSYESERERLRKKKLKMAGGICAVVLTFAAVAAGVSLYEHMEQTTGVTAAGSGSGQLSTGSGELSNRETDTKNDPAGGEGASGESSDAAADTASVETGSGEDSSEYLENGGEEDASSEQPEEEEIMTHSPDFWSDDNTVYLDDGLYGFDHRIESYLFIGTDGSGNEEGEGEDYQGAMADFLLLMVMDHTNDSYGFIQIDRNTVTEVDLVNTDGEITDTREMQICTSHCYGGNPEESAENTIEAVKILLGELENIDGYYVLNMSSVGTLSDAVGGVEVTLEDDMTSVSPKFRKGETVKLNGEEAEMYVRARMSVGEGDNASRMRRQRAFMDSFQKTVMHRVKQEPNFINQLYKTLKDVAVTDISGNDISRMAEMFRKGKSKGILKFEGTSKTETILEDGLEHETFYPEAESVRDVMKELYSLQLLEEDEEEGGDEEDLEDEDDLGDEEDSEDEEDLGDEGDLEEEGSGTDGSEDESEEEVSQHESTEHTDENGRSGD